MADRRSGDIRPRPRANPLGVVMALLFLTIAAAGFTGDAWWLFSAATKWIIAGAVACLGVVLLLTALPGRRRT